MTYDNLADEDGLSYEECARLIRVSSYSAYSASLVGNPAQIVRQLYEYMQNPKVGNFVFESSTIWYRKHDLNAVGVLEDISFEEVDFGEGFEGWDEEAEGRPHPKEKIFYLRTLDGRRFRWSNASILRVADDLNVMTSHWKK